jgi:hypothetical protein|tara:strand:+ start:3187 stop:3360 length:174 start_codon:yes stop_codon:yes gene_type:complete
MAKLNNYFISYVLRDGKKESVTLRTSDIDNSIKQYERNRDIKEILIIRKLGSSQYHF